MVVLVFAVTLLPTAGAQEAVEPNGIDAPGASPVLPTDPALGGIDPSTLQQTLLDAATYDAARRDFAARTGLSQLLDDALTVRPDGPEAAVQIGVPKGLVTLTLEVAAAVPLAVLQPAIQTATGADLEERAQGRADRLVDRQARQQEREEVRRELGAGVSGPIEDVVNALFVPTAPAIVRMPADEPDAIDVDADVYAAVVALGAPDAWNCTGTVVARRLVLTAAHCAPAAQVLVPQGETAAAETAAIVAVRVHPSADVALVLMDREVVVATPIWRLASQAEPPTGWLTAVGYGLGSGGVAGAAEVRKELDIPARGWGCDQGNAHLLGCRPGFELMLSGWGAVDTCRGDSGGPLFEDVGAGLRMVGVTSRAVANAHVDCGDGGVYTRLDRVSDWLLDEIAELTALASN